MPSPDEPTHPTPGDWPSGDILSLPVFSSPANASGPPLTEAFHQGRQTVRLLLRERGCPASRGDDECLGKRGAEGCDDQTGQLVARDVRPPAAKKAAPRGHQIRHRLKRYLVQRRGGGVGGGQGRRSSRMVACAATRTVCPHTRSRSPMWLPRRQHRHTPELATTIRSHNNNKPPTTPTPPPTPTL